MSAAGRPELAAVAECVRRVADAELLPRYERVGHTFKADGSLVTEADTACQEALTAELARLAPAIPLMGEEMTATEQAGHLAGGEAGLWILDPLDGTGNFAVGIPFFSISLALVVAGRVELAVVYHPTTGECFTAERGAGAWLGDEPLGGGFQPDLGHASALVDFKRLPAGLAAALATHPPYRSQRSFGSVALDWCWVAAGRCHLYVHGGQKVWDLAAGSLILSEAGGHAATLEGEPVFEPALASRSAVAALDGDLFTQWQAWLRAAGEGSGASLG
ncbi:MAG: inositol monophosphatase family protein [Thiohalospira sp.]